MKIARTVLNGESGSNAADLHNYQLKMRTYPCVLTIAGSDCSGGAGIQADIKAISALGAYAASAITAITVQNTLGVTGIHPVPPAYVKGQIEAVMDDIRPKAVKIGMINDAEIVRVIAESILKYHPEYVVFDPVMVSTSGCKLMEDEAIEAITTRLIPLASLITPNLSEAEILVLGIGRGESEKHKNGCAIDNFRNHKRSVNDSMPTRFISVLFQMLNITVKNKKAIIF